MPTVKNEVEKSITLKIKENTNFQKLKLQQMNIKFAVFTLDSIIEFLYKESALRTHKVLKNTYKLFQNINPEPYQETPELHARFWIILKSLELMVGERFESLTAIKSELMEDPEATDSIKAYIEKIGTQGIGYEDSKKLIRKLDDRLRFGYVLTIKEIMREFVNAIDDEEYSSYQAISEDIFQLAQSIVNVHRNINSFDSEDKFTLDSEQFEECIISAMTKLQDQSKILKTSMVGLNTFLSPGYMSKRLYMYLAFPGGGKSQILLRSALDIKFCNDHIKPKDPEKRPCVLYLSMENSIEETIERIFNMVVSSDDIRNYTASQVMKKLKDGGKLTLTDNNNVNIVILYYPNRAITTNDLYGIIQELNDEGDEVISLILDYVKRIAPAEKAPSEKEELKNITNELKNLAAHFNISVITAQQLNRLSASVVDAAIQNKKEDVAKLVGRDGVAGAWEIIENSDVVIILNQEIKVDTNELFMTFKLLKRRYRSIDDDESMRRLDFFHQPYEPGNDIRLLPDIDLPAPLFIRSMSSERISLENAKRGKKNAVDRETHEAPSQSLLASDFNPFNDEISKQF